MAEKLPTPICEVSGLPLPVLPIEPREIGALSMKPNRHHHWHPERSNELQNLAGLAVRKSRVQLLQPKVHDAYHNMYLGPELPTNEGLAFRLGILAAAGVVPRRALDIREAGKTVGLTPAAHARIASTVQIEHTRPLAEFFAAYCAKQDISKLLVEQLLDPETSPELQNQIARDLLGSSLTASLDGLLEEHRIMRKEGALAIPKPPTLYAVARRLVRKHSLGTFTSHLERRFITT